MLNASAAAACALSMSTSMQAEDVLMLPTLLAGTRGKPGTFVELGAFDGVKFSNTLMLEKCFGWQGLLIEANPESFAKLNASARTAHKLYSAVCAAATRPPTVRITLDGGTTAGDITRLSKGRQQRRAGRAVDVPCRPLQELMTAYGFDGADLLSLDVEGSEDSVLATVRPAAFRVTLVEDNGASEVAVRRMLADGGLHPARKLRVMFSSVWVRPGVAELRVPAVFPPKVACRGCPPGGAWVADGKKPTVLHRDLRNAILEAHTTARRAARARPPF